MAEIDGMGAVFILALLTDKVFPLWEDYHMSKEYPRVKWDADPEYPANTPWSRWLEGELEKAETAASLEGERANTCVEGVFLCTRSPHDGKSYAFTLCPPEASEQSNTTLRLVDEVTPSPRLVRVCQVSLRNAGPHDFEMDVLPKVIEVQRHQASVATNDNELDDAGGNVWRNVRTSAITGAILGGLSLFGGAITYLATKDPSAAGGVIGGMSSAGVFYTTAMASPTIAARINAWMESKPQANEPVRSFAVFGGALRAIEGQPPKMNGGMSQPGNIDNGESRVREARRASEKQRA